jgi:hypothetical protein
MQSAPPCGPHAKSIAFCSTAVGWSERHTQKSAPARERVSLASKWRRASRDRRRQRQQRAMLLLPDAASGEERTSTAATSANADADADDASIAQSQSLTTPPHQRRSREEAEAERIAVGLERRKDESWWRVSFGS